jgi:hypothetical protein
MQYVLYRPHRFFSEIEREFYFLSFDLSELPVRGEQASRLKGIVIPASKLLSQLCISMASLLFYFNVLISLLESSLNGPLLVLSTLTVSDVLIS